jgi:hypothetical protein
MIEVFKTNISNEKLARQFTMQLRNELPGCRVKFDLQDCDKILKVEGNQFVPEKVIEVISMSGFECEVLE